METAMLVMLALGLLGAFDTIYYHEYVCRLPVHGSKVAGELRLHALRDFVYGILFLTLPFYKWQGILTVALCLLIVLEISITIWDFNTEAVERIQIGGIGNTERGLHLIMAVVYGVFLASLFPQLLTWLPLRSTFTPQDPLPLWIRTTSLLFGIGVLVSGLRDLLASTGFRSYQFDLFGRKLPE
jgi:hypothetical protein